MPAHPSRVSAAAPRACWIEAPGRAAIRIEPMAAPGAGEVEVRALHSAVSRGTESLVFRGQVPASEFERMRAPSDIPVAGAGGSRYANADGESSWVAPAPQRRASREKNFFEKLFGL